MKLPLVETQMAIAVLNNTRLVHGGDDLLEDDKLAIHRVVDSLCLHRGLILIPLIVARNFDGCTAMLRAWLEIDYPGASN